MEEEILVDKIDAGKAPILVMCEACGNIYEWIRANKQCPVCGSEEHKSIFIMILVGSEVKEVRR